MSGFPEFSPAPKEMVPAFFVLLFFFNGASKDEGGNCTYLRDMYNLRTLF